MNIMSHQVLSAKSIADSPVEHTLNLLQERLHLAEGETNKLSKQLENYGFRRTASAATDRSDGESSCRSEPSGGSQSYDKVVSRVCKMESLITSLTAGMQSLEAEKSTSVNQLMQEKRQILENYGKELKETQDELDKSKKTITTYAEVKTQLEKQIGKLKKDTLKRIETQKLLAERYKEKEEELNAFQTKFSEVSKDLSNQQSNKRKVEDSHATLLLKIQEMEVAVENERNNVENLNEKCIALTEDALMARAEFEKEFRSRLQFQDMMAVHEEEIKAANENLEKFEEDNNALRKTLSDLDASLKAKAAENEKIKKALDSTQTDNDSLKHSLKKAAIDNQVLMKQTKEALSREQNKVDQAIQQQGKILDSAKSSLLGELGKQQKHSQKLDNENLELKDRINELQAKNGELDFNLKIMDQTKMNETARLQNVIASAEKVKEELTRQLKQKEKDLVEMNSSWMKEKTCLFQRYEDITQSLSTVEEKCEKLEREKGELAEKLSWINVKHHSKENLENKFATMVAEKNKLAYDKGVLESKVESLEAQINEFKSVDEERRALQSKYNSIDTQHSELKRACTRADADLQNKTSELDRILNELDMMHRISDRMTLKLKCHAKEAGEIVVFGQEKLGKYKGQLTNAEKSLSQATQAYNDAVEQSEMLIQQTQSTKRKHEEELTSYQSRLDCLEKERESVTETFETMMMTNNNLQKDLEMIQVNMGKKDAEIEALCRDREEHSYVVDELQEELQCLRGKFNKLDNHGNIEVIQLKEELQIEITEKFQIQTLCEKLKSEGKDMRTILKKLTEDYKCKDAELKDYISGRYADLEKVKNEHSAHIEALKEEHRKELNNLKRHNHDLRMLSNKKDKYEDANKMALKTLGEQLKGLEEDKKVYVEKNAHQSKLLDEFMSQIADLQNELSSIIQSQSEIEVKLKEKEKMVSAEKRRRRDAEQKYKILLNGKAEREVLKEKQNNTLQRREEENELHAKS